MTLPPELLERVPTALREGAAYHVPRPATILAKLDANELPFELPVELAAGMASALRDAHLERYPDAAATELRALLARELGAAPQQLVFGNGSDELIAMLCSAFAAPRGEQPATIAYPVPSFVYYRIATINRGLRPLEVPLDERFELDELALIAAIEREDPAVLFLALPNNPTGTLWRMELALELALRFPRTVIVSDEAYFDYSGRTNLGALVPEVRAPNLVVMRTLSKVGLAGLRVGYLVAAPEVALHLEKVRPPYNLGSLAQAAACSFLSTGKEWLEARVAEVVEQREHLAAELAERGLAVFPSEANLLLVRLTPGRAHRVWRALQERGVLVRDFDRPGPLAGCLRITVGTPADHQILLEALDQVLALER